MTKTLYYWGIKARAQTAVLLAAWAEDKDFVWEQQPDWPGLKPQTPFGQLPYLVDGDIKIAQSMAIARYLSRKYHLQGDSDADFAISEQLIEESQDLFNIFNKANYSEDKAKGWEQAFTKEAPQQLEFLEKLLHGHTFASKVTAGDLAIWGVFNHALDLEPHLLDKYPKLKAFYDHLASTHQLKAFIDKKVPAYWKR